MSKFIKTIVDANGNTIFPRTRANAVTMSDGATNLETRLNNIQSTAAADVFAIVDPSLAVKSVNVTTLLSTEVASGSMVRELDGLALNLNIPAGAKIVLAGFDEDDLVFTLNDATTVRIVGAYTALKGDPQTKEGLGLGNVDNTSDANKPISTAMQTELTDITSKLGLGRYTSEMLNGLTNYFDGVTWVPNYFYNTPSNIGSSTTYSYSSLIPVLAGETYQVFPRARFIALFDSNSVHLSTIIVSSSATNNPLFTPMQNGFVRISIYNADSASLKLIKGRVAKVIYNFGDSIAAGDGNGGVGYADLVAQKYGMLCVDQATGGSTLSKVNGQSMVSVLDRITEASPTPPDVIYLEGASNDYTEYRVTGTMSDKYDFAGVYDITTYAGALETAIYNLMAKYPGVPIIWIYSHQQNSRNSKTNGTVTVDYGTMHDLSIEICKKWSVSVVDMYNEGGLNTTFTAHRTTYTNNSDGTHPNANGYNLFYVPKIGAKTREVIVM